MKNFGQLRILKTLTVTSCCSLAVLSTFSHGFFDFALDGDNFSLEAAYDGLIGGSVWFDDDANGLKSDNVNTERGYAGVPVELLSDAGVVIKTTQTDSSGSYLFDGLAFDTYSVRFSKPQSASFSPSNVNNNASDTKDSDADTTTGETHPITLTPSAPIDFSIDAGLVVAIAGISSSISIRNDTYTGVEGSTLSIDVLDNDFLTGYVQALTIVDDGGLGNTLSSQAERLIVDASAAAGTYNIIYRVNCADGSQGEASLTLTIDPPVIPEQVVANDDSAVGAVGREMVIDILANDGPTDDIEDVRILSTSIPGSITFDDNNRLVINKSNEAGAFTCRYEIIGKEGSRDSAEVTVILEEPLVAADDIAQGTAGEDLSIDILGNDTPQSKIEHISIVSSNLPPGVARLTSSDKHAQLAISGVQENQYGTYTLTYQIASSSDVDTAKYVDTATVTIQLDEPDKPEPVFQFIEPPERKSMACNYKVTNGTGKWLDVKWYRYSGATYPNPGIYTTVDVIGPYETKSITMPSGYNPMFPDWDNLFLKDPTDRFASYWWGGRVGIYSQADCGSELLPDNVKIVPPISDFRIVPKVYPRPIWGCAIPDAYYRWYPNFYVYMVEIDGDYADSYRIYDQSRRFMREIRTEDALASPGGVELQWGPSPEGYSHVLLLHSLNRARYVSRVVDGVESSPMACRWNNHATPIALDIDQSGHVERIDGEFSFDLAASGQPQTLGQWFAPTEGILVDTRIEGEISGQHLFGDMGGRFADGFAKLSTWDLNHDGAIQGGELEHLGIWMDLNSNARLDDGELSPLSHHGIIRLSTQHDHYLSSAQHEKGHTLLMEDVWFPVLPISSEFTQLDRAFSTFKELALFKELSLFKEHNRFILPTSLASLLALIMGGYGWLSRRRYRLCCRSTVKTSIRCKNLDPQ